MAVDVMRWLTPKGELAFPSLDVGLAARCDDVER
jgi:hypothetical protein